jgi:hypothetical protein
MLVLESGRIYLEAGEHVPLTCPECEHIMEWFDSKGLIVCQKCDHEGDIEDFSQFRWKFVGVN